MGSDGSLSRVSTRLVPSCVRSPLAAVLRVLSLGALSHSHATLVVTKVNTYGLHYEWTGSNPSLKPLLLTAHQDVVPVEPATINEWKYPPYSGHFDGENVWGRGSEDDKSGLIGIM